jgi:hypothetical protein
MAEQPRDILLVDDSPADVQIFQLAVRTYGRRPWRLYSVPMLFWCGA